MAAPAVHDGLILLEFPQNLKDFGFSSDYEVVELNVTTSGGHRLLTLRLRTSPEVKGRDRHDFTFVFDADDLFVVRSVHQKLSVGSFESQYEYDHQEGRPIFRALAGTSVEPTAPKQSTRLEVTECRFGPIPDSEFAPEPFLARLQPGEIVRKQVEQPSTATLLDWYWLAFVGGGISLAGGSGLALGSRHHHRRAPRAD